MYSYDDLENLQLAGLSFYAKRKGKNRNLRINALYVEVNAHSEARTAAKAVFQAAVDSYMADNGDTATIEVALMEPEVQVAKKTYEENFNKFIASMREENEEWLVI